MMISCSINTKRYLPWILAVLLFVSVSGLASGPVVSGDLFWQLQGGRYMVETGQFIHQDTFSLDADVLRWEHCWLHDLIVYGAYIVGGYDAIALLRGVVLGLTVLALALAARARGSSLLSVGLILPLLFMQTHKYWRDRPQLWTFLCFALFLLLLEGVRAGRIRRGLLPLLLAAVTLFWANLHAGVALAVPVLAAYAAGTWFDGYRDRLGFETIPSLSGKVFGGSCLLVLAAMAVTPDFSWNFKVFLQILKLQDAPMTAGNLDWRPASYASFPAYYYWAAAALVLWLVSFRRSGFVELFLLAGLFYSGIYYERNSIFFFFAGIVILPGYLDAAAQRAPSLFKPMMRPAWVAVTAAALILSVLVFRDLYARNGFFAGGIKLELYPARAAEFIAQEHLPANLYNSYDAGGYLMWMLFPRYKVFWDSRQTSMRMHNAGQIIANGLPGFQALLDHYQVNTLVVQPMNLQTGRRWKLLDVIDERAWSLVFVDKLYLVLVRNNAVEPAWLASHRIPLRVKDDMVVALAEALAATRPQAYWEAARIHFLRGNEERGLTALDRYRALVSSAEQTSEAAEKIRDISGRIGR